MLGQRPLLNLHAGPWHYNRDSRVQLRRHRPTPLHPCIQSYLPYPRPRRRHIHIRIVVRHDENVDIDTGECNLEWLVNYSLLVKAYAKLIKRQQIDRSSKKSREDRGTR
jgi:hypothetical protein